MSAGADTIALAVTGASGACYGLRLLEQLLAAGKQVFFMLSQPGQMVIAMETDLRLPSQPGAIQRELCARFGCTGQQLRVFGREQWTAPVASGSSPCRATVICPCTMATLAAVANGLSRNLIERAADVAIKEQRKLVLVPRETLLSSIHLENMLKLARQGVVILPANPGFYLRPQGVQDLVDFVVARVLDHLGIEHHLGVRWGTEEVAD